MARLNMSVEPLVREALQAAAGRDVNLSIAALEKIVEYPHSNVPQDCLDLAAAIVSYCVSAEFSGQRPRNSQVRALAVAFAGEEAWAHFEVETARQYLLAIVDNEPVPLTSASEVLRITFVLGAWLLASFGPPRQTWIERLDQVLWHLEDAEVEDGQDGGGAP